MAGFYPYLVATLPALHFAHKPPFTLAQFLERCQGLIPEQDMARLSSLPMPAEYAGAGPQDGVLAKWVAYDTALRNELAKIRASRRHLPAEQYARHVPGAGEFFLGPEALAGQRIPAVLDAEAYFDQKRWSYLDELAAGHYFDLPVLIVYAYKLMILERWERVRQADKAALLDSALAAPQAS